MWLSTLSSVDAKPLIVLRERFMVQKIDATDVPIICFPKVSTMFSLENSTLKMMLHPANAAKTSQVLRIPTVKHAFINHGESDKLSSCNPYAKAYDEVWVAGPAARERYALAEVGVEDKDIVEVGRPQLAPIRPYSGRAHGHVHDRAVRPHLGGLGRQPRQHLGGAGRREHREAAARRRGRTAPLQAAPDDRFRRPARGRREPAHHGDDPRGQHQAVGRPSRRRVPPPN